MTALIVAISVLCIFGYFIWEDFNKDSNNNSGGSSGSSGVKGGNSDPQVG